MPRIHLYTSLQLPESGPLLLDQAPSHHLLRVLRARSGQQFTLFNGDGCDYHAELNGSDNGRALVTIRAHTPRPTESPLAITLLLALTRSERLEWALQKAVELGVQRIQPVQCQHSVAVIAEERKTRRTERWREVIIAACEQSSGTTLPELCPPLPLLQALPGVQGDGLVLEPQATDRLRDLPAPRSPLTILSGPEGGLHPDEISAARDLGFRPIRMGPRILRAETAAIAAVAGAQSLWGDL
ncbi:MAG: 16S rRNA (uracil(1498)-N(3))-methyltransferase [Acidithiobacillus sp.]